MSETELLHAMCEAYWKAAPGITSSMRSILELLHANGYRRCAEGQGATQWCAEAERVRANLKALEDEHIAYADDVGDALGQGEDEPLLTCARRVVAEVERLRAELERVKAERDDDRRREYGYSQQTVDAITRERDALRADAERYRWLRSRDVGPSQIWELLSDDRPTSMTLKTESELDAAIDAARGES